MGNGGWLRVTDLDGFTGPVYVRLQDVDGALRVTELYLDGQGAPIQPGALRGISLPAFEAGRVVEDDAQLREALARPGPDLSRLASYFATTSFGPKMRHWIAEAWRAQFPTSGVEQPPYAPRSSGRMASTPLEVTLSAPVDGLTDQFFADLARAYAAAVALGRPPASAIAEALGPEYDRRLVESWIYKARKKGIMPPAPKRGRIL